MEEISSRLVGRALTRLEDRRLLTGHGVFVADLKVDGALHAAFVRSPVAHARLVAVDLAAVKAAPGVVAVFSGQDLAGAGAKPLPCFRPTDSADGTPFRTPLRHAIAIDTVRFAGEAVAMVLAETADQAQEAAGLADIAYEELPVCVEARHSEDRAFSWEKGDRAATDVAFARATRTVEIEVVNGRILISPIEPRGAVASYDPATGRYTLHAPTQGVHLVRRLIAPSLGIEPQALRVITNDVGGSFGAKLVNAPEQTALLIAARVCGRPVRWVATRSENHLSDTAGRDHVSRGVLALDESWRILGLRVETVANLGAYASSLGPSPPTIGFAATLSGPYAIAAAHLTVDGRYTNAAPTDAYRGAGKPESIYLLERLIERAARLSGLGSLEFRRRNLIRPEGLPYRTVSGYLYDSGDFPAVLDRAAAAAGWPDFAARRAASEARGKRRGIGVGMYVHTTGVTSQEMSRVRVDPCGFVAVETGLQSSGQGHETAFAQLVAERLGLGVEEVRIIQGDSASAGSGGPTAGSSSIQAGGLTMLRAAEAMLEAAKQKAADHLEVAAGDVTFANGHFVVRGTDRRVHLFALAQALDLRGEGGCAGEAALDGNMLTIPNGAYVCEVEIDPETGSTAIVRFTGVDDIGRRLNPQLAAGQIHGGIAQGIGQALHEQTVFDPQSGQMLTGSLMDYGLPRADDLPMFDLHSADIPTANNILGMKGAGEIGCIGAPAAVMNAIADAVGHDRLDMPATPERVWRALRQSQE